MSTDHAEKALIKISSNATIRFQLKCSISFLYTNKKNMGIEKKLPAAAAAVERKRLSAETAATDTGSPTRVVQEQRGI